MKKTFYLISCLLALNSFAQDIKINQLGFYPASHKVAVVPSTSATTFQIRSLDTSTTFYSGSLSAANNWSYSSEDVKLASFTDFQTPGSYKVFVPGFGASHDFIISEDVHDNLLKDLIRAYYLNRASISIDAPYAGIYARALGHPDNSVEIHASAASAARPEGTIISSPKGWYDAGDFGKYIVNSGISTYTILASYEHFPVYYQNIDLNIPESGNNVPDILDEAKWNVDWMLTMQDPNDGGVYHKLTTKNFAGTVMPAAGTAQRYVVQKGTAATLDFAAVMAVASRIYADYETEFPGYSAQCLNAAYDAWNWANANSNVPYIQPPDINTGGYGDSFFGDEFNWAAAELYITTKQDSFYTAFNEGQASDVPGWQAVGPLGWMSLAFHKDSLTPAANQGAIVTGITGIANTLRSEYNSSAYNVAMGARSWDFVWGSNGVAGNEGMMLIQAYRLTGDTTYLDAALSNLDYLLGRNATGYSFVTGNGDNTPMNIHHRASAADGITNPVPGFVAGGPQPGQQDGCSGYPSNDPGLSYVDSYCSYSTNEITINWNAPAVYLAGAMEWYRGAPPNTAPIIITQPVSDTAGEGTSHVFTVSATGQPVLTYQWQHNGIDISGATTSSLNLTNLALADSGAYRVIVSNGLGSDTSVVAWLTILTQTPFGGTPWPIPGLIQAEDYDDGGEGLGYHDEDGGNAGGSNYRNDDVDIEVSADTGATPNVGWIDDGEWLEYTVNVAFDGIYKFEFRVATNTTGSDFKLQLDGSDITGTIAVPFTSGWQTWTTIQDSGIFLTSGIHVLRFDFTTGPFNFNLFNVTGFASDCNGEVAGSAFLDSCGQCAGGSTGITPELDPMNCITVTEDITDQITVYPNPFEDEIKINSTTGTLFEYHIFSSNGSLIKNGSTDGTIKLDSGFSPGLYLLKLQNNAVHATYRLLKR